MTGIHSEQVLAVIAAWRTAAQELHFEFLSPFTLMSDRQQLACLGVVAGFGSPKGTVIVSMDDISERFASAARRNGFVLSGLRLDVYRNYERLLFIDTLRDWGWLGQPDQRPSWLEDAGPDESAE